jgi:hypothetical protein
MANRINTHQSLNLALFRVLLIASGLMCWCAAGADAHDGTAIQRERLEKYAVVRTAYDPAATTSGSSDAKPATPAPATTSGSNATMAVAAPAPAPAPPPPLTALTVIRADAPGSPMAGGIGASWHAIRKHTDLSRGSKKYKWGARASAPQGSAVGGNPPLDSTAAWKDIERLGTWLGMDWLRVEIDRRMYEPERGKFDWNSDEMQTLYRMLDWCERNRADVFLTEMWRDVEWLAYPDVHPLISAPNELEPYAQGLATLIDHLTHTRKYTCIKWLCINNEPPFAGVWGYWWMQNNKPAPFVPGVVAVRKALNAKGISLPISGPGVAGVPTRLPEAETAIEELDPFVGAFDFHCYGGGNRTSAGKIADWAAFARSKKKPMFISEMGDMGLGWGGSKPAPASFEAALSVGELVLRAMNAGAGAFNRWSFTNQGDIDGQWQLVRTWDIDQKRYRDRVEPETFAYYGYAMLTRFTAKYSSVLPCTLGFSEDANTTGRIVAAALRSPRGALTAIFINRDKRSCKMSCHWAGIKESTQMQRYQMTEERIAEPGFAFAKDGALTLTPNGADPMIELPPRSITVLTTYDLAADAPGVTEEAPSSRKRK